EGLQKMFPGRVFDTPLAESGIVGASIGLAACGFRPVAEMQFEGFIFPAFDQIVNHASRIRNRSRGRFTCPIVIRSPIGGGVKGLEHHSESPEAYFAHIPGIKVVIPSTPYDAKGLLVSAIRDPDPVIFFEPKRIYRAIKQDVPDKEYTIPLGKARVVAEGTDVTVISYGAMVRECEQAVENLKDHVSIELIDLRTIRPLDVDTVMASVKKTGRVVIVHEAQKTMGVAAEVIALINEHALLSLNAPVERVTGYDVIVPLPKLEEYYVIDEKRIAEAIEKVVNF
ncbi:MAG TPA: alpha-ketoacid dehydrogenase subunit beta, partial [Candidatus Nanoarchaeia archaeon]|nr:alpha-ketoacid dehydrogenase subunit beta [Candidatus Nanoarchaeia archaeon]